MKNALSITLEDFYEFIIGYFNALGDVLHENFDTITEKLENIEILTYIAITLSLISITTSIAIYLSIKKRIKEQTQKMLEIQTQNLEIYNKILEQQKDKT